MDLTLGFELFFSYISGLQYGAIIVIITLLCKYLGRSLFQKIVAWITNQ